MSDGRGENICNVLERASAQAKHASSLGFPYFPASVNQDDIVWHTWECIYRFVCLFFKNVLSFYTFAQWVIIVTFSGRTELGELIWFWLCHSMWPCTVSLVQVAAIAWEVLSDMWGKRSGKGNQIYQEVGTPFLGGWSQSFIYFFGGGSLILKKKDWRHDKGL